MSGGMVRTFVPVLREVERGMALPIPDRIRILRELEFDLEDLTGRLVADGVPPDAARSRALEALVPDRGVLEALDLLHSPWYRRVTRHLTPEGLRRTERAMLALATVGVLAAEALALVRVDVLHNRSPFLFPVLMAGLALFATAAAKAFQLWVKRDPSVSRRGMHAILSLSAASLLTGVLGALIDVYRLSGILARSPELAEMLVPVWLMRDAALLATALMLALAGGLV